MIRALPDLILAAICAANVWVWLNNVNAAAAVFVALLFFKDYSR
jgi:hypothetical protein